MIHIPLTYEVWLHEDGGKGLSNLEQEAASEAEASKIARGVADHNPTAVVEVRKSERVCLFAASITEVA